MDPNSRGPEDEHGHDSHHFGAHDASGMHHPRAVRDVRAAALAHGSGKGLGGRGGDSGTGGQRVARTVRLVSGAYLLTVNPVDGSEVEPCPPGETPDTPRRRTREERDEARRTSSFPRPGAAQPELPLLERQEERERLVRLLSRGRSVRLTGPSGSGRTTLLNAVAAECAGLAPDGVVRLSGHQRTPTDLLYELFAAVHHAPLHRPDRAQLLDLVGRIGAVVVLDDIEFGGSALDELLDATPECAFLISALPDVAAPSPDSHLEEVFLPGLGREACRELLAAAAQRPLTEEETAWAADLWFESEGLPRRFVQAGALLRQRDIALEPDADEVSDEAEPHRSDDGTGADDQPGDAHDQPGAPLPSVAEAAAPAALMAGRLSEAAQAALRFAVALDGACPHQAHLPALIGDTHADAAVGELLGCGLLTPVGAQYRLTAGVATQLEAAGYAEEAAARAHTAAQHYAWWAGHPSVSPERVATEADAILATLSALVGSREAGHASAAVLLARTVAPVFAAGGQWSAWERALRHGQEAARLAGEVAEEAYFHHELGVLALCTGNLERARAELEASIGLRGVLADRRGAVAGRRALALVADKAAGFDHSTGRTSSGEDVAGTRVEGPISPAHGIRAALAAPGPDEIATIITPRLASATRGGGPAKRLGIRATLLSGARRNMAAVGAGALLVAVLGTVLTIGAASDGDGGAPDRVTTEQTADDDGGFGDYTGENPPAQGGTRQPQPDRSAAPGASGVPVTEDSGEPSGRPSGSAGPSASKTRDTQGPKDPTTSPTPTRTPRPTKSTSHSSSPSQTPSSTPTSSSPSPSGSVSTTASGPATTPSSGTPIA